MESKRHWKVNKCSEQINREVKKWKEEERKEQSMEEKLVIERQSMASSIRARLFLFVVQVDETIERRALGLGLLTTGKLGTS